MWHTEIRFNAIRWKAASRVMVCSILALAYSGIGASQTAETLAQVKKVYVEPFGQENGATKRRDRVVEELKRKAKLEIVAAPVRPMRSLKGTGVFG